MKVSKIKIKNIIDLLETYSPKDYILSMINSYFIYRISNKKMLDDSDIEDLYFFVNKFKNIPNFTLKQKHKVLSKIEKLFIFSLDNSRYEKYLYLRRKKINELCEKDILEYLDILVKNCKCCLPLYKIELLINEYLTISNNNNILLNLVYDNSDLFFQKENKNIYNFTLNIILKRVYYEIKNSTISSIKLYESLNKLTKIEVVRLSNINIILFRDIIKELDDFQILYRYDNIIPITTIDEKIEEIFNNLIRINNSDTKIKHDIIKGNINVNSNFSPRIYTTINFKLDLVPYSLNERIITIDEEHSPDLDGAFSIKKVDGVYDFSVYVTDVPVFLKNNRKVCEEAYLRGTSMYFKSFRDNNTYIIDMLPPILSHHYLSLHFNEEKNVIVFNFIIGTNGKIYSQEISRQKIKVSYKLTPEEAIKIIRSKHNYGALQMDLLHYKNLCKIISQTSEFTYLKHMKSDNIFDLISLPSILSNYYVGKEAQFAIYRKNGSYTTDSTEVYTHSVTPLRRFVSNINLAFLLEQKGIVSFPEKDLSYVINHSSDIIDHINERDKIGKVVEKNPAFARKYILKRKL